MAFSDTQKANFLKEMDGLGNKIQTVRQISRDLVDTYYGVGLQSGAPNELTQADVDATAYAGVTLQEIYNVIGSLESLEAFLVTHDENLFKVMS